MPYKVETPDGAWHSTDDLTGAELEAIEKVVGTPWSILNPFKEIAAYRAIVAAFAIRDGMTDSELREWFGARTAKQLGDGLDVATDDDLPDEFVDGVPLAVADAPLTPTSASSPDHLSDGRPTS